MKSIMSLLILLSETDTSLLTEDSDVSHASQTERFKQNRNFSPCVNFFSAYLEIIFLLK